MSQIDWSKAPEWAVAHALHAFDGGICEVWVGEDQYQRLGQMKAFPYGGGNGETRTNSRRSEFSFEQPRPKPWNGEGLPPVGTVCELRAHKLNVFSSAIIRFASRNVVVWDWEEEPALNGLCTAYVHDVEIRPIRTAEQIAADERLHKVRSALTAISQGIDVWNLNADCSAAIRATVEAMIDDGYRKQEPTQ